jgi:ribosomal protein L37E
MSNQNWWAQKLGGQPAAPTYRAPAQPQPQQPNLIPTGQNNLPPVQHAVTERCPGCGSNNYGGTAETRKRCYDCGYPIVQSGSGMGRGITSGPRTEGAPQPAKQVQAGGWNPNVIIGKIE